MQLPEPKRKNGFEYNLTEVLGSYVISKHDLSKVINNGSSPGPIPSGETLIKFDNLEDALKEFDKI